MPEGRRAAARRLAGGVRRRLGLPAQPAAPPAQERPADAGEEAAARIDAARERLRARIATPEDERTE